MSNACVRKHFGAGDTASSGTPHCAYDSGGVGHPSRILACGGVEREALDRNGVGFDVASALINTRLPLSEALNSVR